MIYEIVVRKEIAIPYDMELLHDNPLSALEVYKALRMQFADPSIVILRDDVQITAAALASDIETYEIRTIMEEECRLPSTYRHGRGGDSDLAVGSDGYQHAVWRPKNPEDDFS